MGLKLPTLRVNFVKFWEGKADSIEIQNLVGIMDGFGKKTNEQIEQTKLTGNFICAQPFQRVILRYNGTILSCCTFYAAEMPIGKLKDRQFEKNL